MAFVVEEHKEEAKLRSGPIKLLGLDPSGDTWVEFRRPSRREVENLAEFEGQVYTEWDEPLTGRGEGTVRTFRQKDVQPLIKTQSRMVALTLIGTNIKMREKDRQPIFVAGKNCRTATDTNPAEFLPAFYEVWGGLPDSVCRAIYKQLAIWHPPFDTVGYSVMDQEPEPEDEGLTPGEEEGAE